MRSKCLAGAPKVNGRGDAGRGRGRGRRGGRGDRSHGSREPRQQGPPAAPPVPVPNEDFNFEDGLSKFDKDKIKEVRFWLLCLLDPQLQALAGGGTDMTRCIIWHEAVKPWESNFSQC